MGRHHAKHRQGGAKNRDLAVALPPAPFDIEVEFFGIADNDLDAKQPVVVKDSAYSNDEAAANVLSSIASLWNALTSDATKANDHIDDAYIGWFSDDPTPDTKTTVARWNAISIQERKTVQLHISPMAVRVHDGFAIAQYTYIWLYVDAGGHAHKEFGRYTDVLRPMGDSWILAGSHGGPDDLS